MNDYSKELSEKGVIAFVAHGNSMWPTIKNAKSSTIIIKKTERLKKYDVGFFIRPTGNYVLHRVIQVLDDGYLFSGDSQYVTEFIKEDNVLGILKGFYRGKKYIDCNSKEYINEVNKYYKNERKRIRKIKRFYFILRVKNKIKRTFRLKAEN